MRLLILRPNCLPLRVLPLPGKWDRRTREKSINFNTEKNLLTVLRVFKVYYFAELRRENDILFFLIFFLHSKIS